MHNEAPAQLPEAQQFCPTSTRRKVTEEGALMVDVRERAEVEQLAFDMPGVIHIPMSEFEARYAELPRDCDLILVCAVGQRSLKATYFLMYHGYTRVANMSDGMDKWQRKGFPVKGESATATSAAGGCCSPKAKAGGCCDAPAQSAKPTSCC